MCAVADILIWFFFRELVGMGDFWNGLPWNVAS